MADDSMRAIDQSRQLDDYLSSLPNLRRDALLFGSNRYFTGAACKNGHITFRYASSGSCFDCIVANDIRSNRVTRPAWDIRRNGNGRPSKMHDAVWRWSRVAAGNARAKVKSSGITFNILPTYIYDLCVTHCPVLGMELIYGNRYKQVDNSASLDRIVPNIGYIEGNVHVISLKANRIKNDATLEEFEAIYRWRMTSVDGQG